MLIQEITVTIHLFPILKFSRKEFLMDIFGISLAPNHNEWSLIHFDLGCSKQFIQVVTSNEKCFSSVQFQSPIKSIEQFPKIYNEIESTISKGLIEEIITQ